jgi:hypothetical protein
VNGRTAVLWKLLNEPRDPRKPFQSFLKGSQVRQTLEIGGTVHPGNVDGRAGDLRLGLSGRAQ